MSHETFEHEIEVQYRDLDPRKHVNHAVYVSYLEQAKARLFVDVLGTSLADAPTALRNLEVEYVASVLPDRTVEVALGPVEVGRTSFTIEYEISVDGEIAATARTVSVHLDEDGSPAPIPESWRNRLAPYASGDGE